VKSPNIPRPFSAVDGIFAGRAQKVVNGAGDLGLLVYSPARISLKLPDVHARKLKQEVVRYNGLCRPKGQAMEQQRSMALPRVAWLTPW
jgi:hypothetical protein